MRRKPPPCEDDEGLTRPAACCAAYESTQAVCAPYGEAATESLKHEGAGLLQKTPAPPGLEAVKAAREAMACSKLLGPTKVKRIVTEASAWMAT